MARKTQNPPTDQQPDNPPMSTQDPTEQNPPPRNIHIVKMHDEYYEAYRGRKRNAQVRINDRSYREGDLIIVNEYSPLLQVKTGREFIAVITNISNPPGLLPQHVLMHTKHLT